MPSLSRTQAAHRGSPYLQPGWAYAHKSQVWHQVDAYGRTSCGHEFNTRLATWCPSHQLPNEAGRCQRCEASRARLAAQATEQARIKHETRHQLTLTF